MFGLMPVVASAPKLAVAEPGFDFGRALKGAVIEHTFVLRNEGDSPLVIEELRMTPPLTMIVPPHEIRAGGEGALRFRLDTSNTVGVFEGQILLSLNDPEQPRFRLTFIGTVFQSVEVVPRPAFFVVAQRGETGAQSLEVISHEPEPLRIENVSHPVDRFTTRLEAIQPGRRYRLTLLLKGHGAGGRRTDTIVVTTSSKITPAIRIAANTFVRDRVYTFPDSIDVGTFPLAALGTNPDLLRKLAQTLMVYRKGTDNFDVKLTSDLDVLEIRTERGPAGDRWQATITLKRELLKPGSIRGSILIETNDPDFRTLTVPVTGMILPVPHR
jgi:hypothetical protein